MILNGRLTLSSIIASNNKNAYLKILSLNLSSSSTAAANTNQYKYTLDNYPILSKQQRDDYEKNGFLVIRKLIEPEKLDVFKKRFQEVCSKKIKVPGMTVMKDIAIAKSEYLEGEKAITKIQDFCYDDELFKYCCLPEIVQYVKAFVGENVQAMHTMLINKPPDPGTKTSRHPLHQDLYYFPFRPAERIVCAWTAMEKINPENGCLVVDPGTHTNELLEHSYPNWEGGVNKMYYGIQNYDFSKNRLVSLEMNTGDTVFFHPLLIHGSGTNRTSGFRKAISCHYADSACNYVDVEGTKQDLFKREVEQIASKRMGQPVEIRDVWRLKSRLVCGERINL